MLCFWNTSGITVCLFRACQKLMSFLPLSMISGLKRVLPSFWVSTQLYNEADFVVLRKMFWPVFYHVMLFEVCVLNSRLKGKQLGSFESCSAFWFCSFTIDRSPKEVNTQSAIDLWPCAGLVQTQDQTRRVDMESLL